ALTATGTTGNLILGNFIGTDVNGSLALGNMGGGVSISGGASNNTVGGTAAGARNLISANGFGGVGIVDKNATGNMVLGNYIGTDVTGMTALGNGVFGVNIVRSDNNIVGGTTS